MRKGIETISFVLLLIGTFGLLVNEFVFKWTTIVTLTFAVANVIGLFALGIALNCAPVVKTKMMVRICRESHATLTNLFWL